MAAMVAGDDLWEGKGKEKKRKFSLGKILSGMAGLNRTSKVCLKEELNGIKEGYGRKF